jgi:hypothetical protein
MVSSSSALLLLLLLSRAWGMGELGRRIRMLTKKLTARHFRSLGCAARASPPPNKLFGRASCAGRAFLSRKVNNSTLSSNAQRGLLSLIATRVFFFIYILTNITKKKKTLFFRNFFPRVLREPSSSLVYSRNYYFFFPLAGIIICRY